MENSNNNRIFYIDFIRAFAIICVLLSHVVGKYALGTPTSPAMAPILGLDIGRFGVPLFFMISGALLIGKEYPSISYFLKKRFLRVVYPFVFWIIVIGIYFVYFDNNLQLFIKILSGNPYMWFVYALIGIYLFVPIFSEFIKKYSIRGDCTS